MVARGRLGGPDSKGPVPLLGQLDHKDLHLINVEANRGARRGSLTFKSPRPGSRHKTPSLLTE